jgi:DNA-binding GntR family transcriptional regulator
MFELRQIIEHATLERVARDATPRQLAALRKLVTEERAAHTNGDRPRWIRLSAQFHLELALLTDNALLVDTLRRLVSRTTLLIATVEAPGQNACSFDEHDDVLTALENGKVALAQKHMAHHLHNCEERVQPEDVEDFDLQSVLGVNRPSKSSRNSN